MAQIWRFTLDLKERQELVIPALSDPLCVHVQFDRPCIWLVCEAGAKPRRMEVITVGTSVDLETRRVAFLGTYVLPDGANHVFWRWKDQPA